MGVDSNKFDDVFEIGISMYCSDISEDIIGRAISKGVDLFDNRVYNLMILWRDEEDKNEKKKIISTLEKVLDD